MKPFDPRMLRLVPESRLPVAAIALTTGLQGLATIATAFALTALVVDVVTGTALWPAAGWVAALLTIRGLAGAATELVSGWAGARVGTAVRRRLLARLLGMPGSDPGRADLPELAPETAMTLATQGPTSLEPYVTRFLPALVTAGCLPVLAIATLAVVDWRSALVVVLTVPLLPLFAALIGRTTEQATQRRWAALASLAGHFLDVVRGLPTLVGYGRAQRQSATVRQVSEQHRLATMGTLRLAFLSSSALELLATIAVALVAVLNGLRLAAGDVSLWAALVAILLAPEAYWPIRRVGQEFHAAADGSQAFADLVPYLQAAGDGERPHTPLSDNGTRDEVGVTLGGVSYTYPGSDRPVLRDVDLTAGPGLTALTGASGCGKSTVLDVIAGIRLPQHGTVDAAPAHLVGQRPFLPAGTVREILSLGQGAQPDKALWHVLREVELDGMVAALPEGLGSRIGDDGFGLSAGQRTRLALARSLLSSAPVLLLDEPTAHLDRDSARLVRELVVALGERHTVIAVTHDPELSALADRVVTLGAQVPA